MGLIYTAVGFMVIPAVLFLYHRLSRHPGVTSQPHRAESPVADEAERWLRAQSRG